MYTIAVKHSWDMKYDILSNHIPKFAIQLYEYSNVPSKITKDLCKLIFWGMTSSRHMLICHNRDIHHEGQ